MKKLVVIIIILAMAFSLSIMALADVDEKPLERTEVRTRTGYNIFPPADPTNGSLLVRNWDDWKLGYRSTVSSAITDKLTDDEKESRKLFYLGSMLVVIGELPQQGIVDSNYERATGSGWISFDLGDRAKSGDTVHIIIQRYGWNYDTWTPLNIEPLSFEASPVSIGDKVFWVIDIFEYKAILNNLANRYFLDFYAHIYEN